ncbi:MAG: DnaJ domain-containing protein [Methyloceanibacter sp.]
MAYFLVGCALLVLLILGARMLVKADPRRLAGTLRKAGGVAALAAAGFLILRGALPLAIPLAVFGLSLLGRGSGGPLGASRTPGQKSEVRTERLEMQLDHDTGDMDGKCLAGRFAGRTLSSFADFELMELLQEFRADGAQETALIEAYLDWRLPGWRDRDTGERAKAQAGRARSKGRGMSAEEAYAVLGVGPGASSDDIKQAHHKLMMKMHPDQGGSTYLAARINEAKDVLLGGK